MAHRPRSQPLNRSREEIMGNILESLLSPSNKTMAMNNSRISFTQMQTYLDILVAKGLAEARADGMWVITERGRKYLQALESIRNLVPSVAQ